LAEKRVRPKSSVSIEPLLVPIRTALDLVKALEACEGMVSMRFSANQLSCTFDDMYVTTRLVDGAFPDYQQIIPSDTMTKAVFLKQDIVAAVKKAAIFSDRFNQVTFELSSSAGAVKLLAVSAEVGEMNDVVEGGIEGDDLTISFNQKYLMDSFQSIEAESVSLSFSGPGRPMVIRGVGDDSFLYLVMPMNK
jgi:DNA polymerase III subunit beta